MNIESLVVPSGIVALIGYSLLSGGAQNVGDALSTGSSIKQLRQQISIENVMADTKAEALAVEAVEALERYKSGCIIHAVRASEQDPKHTAVGKTTLEYQSIREGGVYHSWRDGEMYSPGACLADADGNTGIIGENGELTLHRYTGANVAKYVLGFFDRYDKQ